MSPDDLLMNLSLRVWRADLLKTYMSFCLLVPRPFKASPVCLKRAALAWVFWAEAGRDGEKIFMMVMMIMNMGFGEAWPGSRGTPGRSWASKLSQTAKSWWMETGCCWSHWASRLVGWLAPSAKERRRTRTGLIDYHHSRRWIVMVMLANERNS